MILRFLRLSYDKPLADDMLSTRLMRLTGKDSNSFALDKHAWLGKDNASNKIPIRQLHLARLAWKKWTNHPLCHMTHSVIRPARTPPPLPPHPLTGSPGSVRTFTEWLR